MSSGIAQKASIYSIRFVFSIRGDKMCISAGPGLIGSPDVLALEGKAERFRETILSNRLLR